MTRKITLKIEGMECPNCAMILEGIEDKLKGIVFAEASYHKTRLTVEYDEKVIGEEEIRAEIGRLGYQAAETIPNC